MPSQWMMLLKVVEDSLDRSRMQVVDVVAEGLARGWPKQKRKSPGVR